MSTNTIDLQSSIFKYGINIKQRANINIQYIQGKNKKSSRYEVKIHIWADNITYRNHLINVKNVFLRPVEKWPKIFKMSIDNA